MDCRPRESGGSGPGPTRALGSRFRGNDGREDYFTDTLLGRALNIAKPTMSPIIPARSARRCAGCGAVSSIVHCGSARPSSDIAEHHAHARADPDLLRPFRAAPVRRRGARDCRSTRSASSGRRLALLRVEVDQQDQVGRLAAKGRLDRVVHLAVGMHRALALDRFPGGFRGSCTTGRRWSAGSATCRIRAGLQVKIVLGAVLEICRRSRHRDRRCGASCRYIRRRTDISLSLMILSSFPRKREPRDQRSSLPLDPVFFGARKRAATSRGA